MSNAKQLAEAQAQTRRAERAAMKAEIRLAIVNDKIAAHERAEARQLKAVVQSAVQQMVKSGAIHRYDHSAQLDMAGQLISDSSLIPLALTPRIFGQQNRKVKA